MSKFKVSRELRQATKRNAKMIEDSRWFLVLYNESMLEEVVPLMQLGLAVYLDKPIYLLVPRGTPLPMNLRRLALHVAYYDRDDAESMAAATAEVTQQMKH